MRIIISGFDRSKQYFNFFTIVFARKTAFKKNNNKIIKKIFGKCRTTIKHFLK